MYPVLKAMEEAGKVRRGYFVEQLGGAQFASPGAVDRLRALRDPQDPEAAVVLSALDPASPFGWLLPWPGRGEDRERSGGGRRHVHLAMTFVLAEVMNQLARRRMHVARNQCPVRLLNVAVFELLGQPGGGLRHIPAALQIDPGAGMVEIPLSASDRFHELLGRSVAMGDFDGDHLADVVISALGINTVYVVSGNTVNTARDNLNLANLNGANGGVKLVGPAGIDFGKQVVNVGDVNADGRDDFLVLAPKAFPVAGGSFGGAAYVVFGTNNTTLQTVNVATLNGSNGFLVHGAIFRPAFGTYGGLVNAAAAGDVNGDGIADIVLTQTLVPQGFDQLGETFVIYGKAGSFADVNNLDLHTGLNGSNGFRIVGAGDDARVSVVAGGGDLNNDGFDEMLLSMPRPFTQKFKKRSIRLGLKKSAIVCGF